MTGKADDITPEDLARADALAGGTKRGAYGGAELEHARTVARVSQVVDCTFYLLYGLIGLEIVLELLGARDSGAFNRFVDTVTMSLLAPFQGTMPPFGAGPFRVTLSCIVALVAYLMLHLSLHGLLWLFAYGKKGLTLDARRSTPVESPFDGST